MGDLRPEAQKGFGKVAKLYNAMGKNFFCTSIREGNHGKGSLHYIGFAWDFKKQGISINKIKDILGQKFDVIDEGTHVHAEYDPK